MRISPELLLFGFLIRTPNETQAQRKALKQNPASEVKKEVIDRITNLFITEAALFSGTEEAALAEIVNEYRKNSMFKADLLEIMKPEIQRSLSFLHDYRQFVSQVKQNINVVLQSRFPSEGIDSQLRKATKAETAIYWAAAMMEDKLETSLLLLHPEHLVGANKNQSRPHGAFLKIIRIYQAAFDEKGVRLTHKGSSVGETIGPKAFSVIPHTLLDNALKYSSRGSDVIIEFQEDAASITISVTSYGPKIEESERASIFEAFQRGKHGAQQEEEGSGVGLYLAQMVANAMGTEIKVSQSPQKGKFGFETRFSVRLPRVN